MKKKSFAAVLISAALLVSLTGCANSGAKTSEEATADNPMVLTLAHGLSESHTVHIAMTEFAQKVEGAHERKSAGQDLSERAAWK